MVLTGIFMESFAKCGQQQWLYFLNPAYLNFPFSQTTVIRRVLREKKQHKNCQTTMTCRGFAIHRALQSSGRSHALSPCPPQTKRREAIYLIYGSSGPILTSLASSLPCETSAGRARCLLSFASALPFSAGSGRPA